MPSSLRDTLQASLGSQYILERELGGGGMSQVFLAEEAALGRKVVIKVLPPEMGAALSGERFRREVGVAARLQHPHIVPLLSAGEAAGLPYYTMPFVAGESLRARLARGGRLPPAEAVSILRDVARALAAAHEQGVVHRDIKPDNILLTGGSAAVTDFGVAKALSAAQRTAEHAVSGDDDGSLTQLGVALGTPAYVAPEQAAADPNVDHRADIYALGATAYEMLAGASPFAGRTPQAMMVAHITEAPEPLALRAPDCPPALAALVMRCLEKDPAQRPQTAGEVLAALDAAITDGGERRGASGERPGAPPPLAPPLSPPRRSWILVGVLALAAVAGVAGEMWRRGRSERGEGEDPARGGAAAAPAVQSVAVLPFSVTGSDSSDAYFAEGMTDELIVALQKVPGVRVAARTSVFALRGRGLTADSLARMLRVRTLLDGTVRRAGDRLRVTATLSNAADGATIWSERYEGTTKDVFAVQDSITRSIVGALQVQLAGGARPGALRGTEDLGAYDLYLRGLFQFQKRGQEELRQAVALFRQATERDPSFARAFAGLASALTTLPAWTGTSVDSIRAPARAAAERAIALDASLGEPHAALGVLAHLEARYDESEAAFRRAIANEPRSATALQWYGELLFFTGRIDESIDMLRRATEADPAAATPLLTYAYALGVARRFDQSLPVAERALSLDTRNAIAHGVLGLQYAGVQRYEEALREMRAGYALAPVPYLAGKLGGVYARAGMRDSATAIVRRLEGAGGRGAPSPETAFALAAVLGELGDTARALDMFDRATERPGAITSGSLLESAFDPIRASPRFAAAVRRLGLDPARLTRRP